MKNLFILLLAVLLRATVFAQAPQKMSYQAVIHNSSNNLVTNQVVGMRISILQGATTGTPVYIETQNPTSNGNGLVSLEIGGGNVVTGSFATINWANGPFYIKTETDPSGGTTYNISGTTQLLSVPFALYAKTAENGFSGSYNDLTNKPVGSKKGDMQYWNGSEWVYISAGSDNSVLTMTNGTPKWSTIFTQSEMVVDIDGNVYHTVKIGDQTWFIENLKTTRFRNGDLIGSKQISDCYVQDISQWPYDADDNKVSIYGRLYTWSIVTDSRSICPVGWHIPSNAEWTTLINYLGGESLAGGKLKESGLSHWNIQNADGTNETGFSALPGGMRSCYNYFTDFGLSGHWWTSTEEDQFDAFQVFLLNNSGGIGRGSYGKNSGFSVRCIKD